ncbi:MAG: helix-turn-helix domain-containing protein [Acidobacteriota bacterium]
MDQTDLLDIGEVAAQTGLAASTLRHWESEGLIEPAGRRGLRRQYVASTLETIAHIRLAQSAGFSLAEISTWIRADGPPEVDRGALRAKADELDRTIEHLAILRDQLRHVADCPAPRHAECPNFRQLLRRAMAGVFDRDRRSPPAR